MNGATHSPLDEPDVKISLIRLSGKFPTAGMRKSSRSRTNQQLQSHVQELLGVGLALGRTEGSLASPSHVVVEALQYVGVDPPVSRPWVSETEVVAPAFQVSIQLRNQSRQGLMTLGIARHGP